MSRPLIQLKVNVSGVARSNHCCRVVPSPVHRGCIHGGYLVLAHRCVPAVEHVVVAHDVSPVRKVVELRCRYVDPRLYLWMVDVPDQL
jgi:hypothetical protein